MAPKDKESRRRPQIQCVFCGQLYRSSYQDHRYVTHILGHIGERPFSCKFCGKSFNSVYCLRTHVKNVCTINKSMLKEKCSVCSQGFPSKNKLRYHMISHTGPRHECGICQRKFKMHSHLSNHILTHTGENPFQCSFCKQRFRRKENLENHEKSIHSSGNDCYKCKFCGKGFGSKHNLKIHERQHPKEGYISCHICEKSFRDQDKLNSHKRRHIGGDKRFECPLCPHRGYTMGEIKWHVMCVHTKERPYKCSVPSCKSTFRSRGHLNVHVSTVHERKKLFPCVFCGLRFSWRAILHSHLRKHINEYPFMCNKCDKVYVQYQSLKSHKKIHGNLRFECVFCKRLFVHKYVLYGHLRYHTKEKC